MRSGIKLSAMVLVVFSLTPLAFSQEHRFGPPTLQPPVNDTLHDIIERMRASKPSHGPLSPRSQVAWGDTEPLFIFPLIGSTPGSGGTYFHTESVIANERNQPQDVEIFWFPIGGGSANCNRPAVKYTIPANHWYYWDDLAAQVLNVSGLGAVAVVAVDSTGEADETAHIDGFSKIWTYIPGTTGTVAQSFAAESVNLNANVQGAYGLRQDAGFRTNVGIFNYDIVQRTFTVSILGSNGNGSTDVTVDACNVSLFSAPAGNWGRLLLGVSSDDGKGLWYAFGSSVDNVSGASWSSVAHPY